LLIASDSLAYSPGLSPIGFVDKVFPIPRLRLAIGGRGMASVSIQAAAELSGAPT